MREAIAVDGSGSPPSMQIIFSAIGEQKEGHCALPLGEGKVLQDAAARRLGEPPPPLHKPLKIYPTFSDLRRLTATSDCTPQGLRIPLFASKTSKNIA